MNLFEQASALGAKLESGRVTSITSVSADGKPIFTVSIGEQSFQGKTVILATGAKNRKLGLSNEQALTGRGVSYCATCDGAFYKDKTVAVVGGGNTALEDAEYLADICKQVYVIQNLDSLTGEQKLRDQLEERENVSVILGSVITALHGDGELDAITIHTEEVDLDMDVEVDGLFIAIGLEPQNGPFAEHIKLNSFGYADSDESCTTDTVGIFVAGDCRQKRIRQVATAASDGAVAALAACDYIDEIK
jgi:thioredoxin reductase (NADPH)